MALMAPMVELSRGNLCVVGWGPCFALASAMPHPSRGSCEVAPARIGQTNYALHMLRVAVIVLLLALLPLCAEVPFALVITDRVNP